MTTADVVIAGNGILALSTAFELTNRNPSLSVAIIGPEAREGAASQAAGAMLSVFAEITKYTFTSGAGQEKFRICRDAAELWPTWMDAVCEASGHEHPHSVSGTVVLENALSGHLDSENFDAMLDALVKYGADHEVMSQPPRIEGLRPIPSARPMRSVYLPGEGGIDSAAVHAALRGALLARGVRFIDAHVRAVVQHHGKVTGVTTGAGDHISSGTALVAAGAFTTPILDTAVAPNEVQPVLAGRGISMVTHRPAAEPFEHVVRTVNRAGDCGLHAIPHPDGRDYVGATNQISAQPGTRPHVGLSHFLIQSATQQLNTDFTHAEIDQWNIGNRPVTLDTYPLLGPGPLDGLHIATGTFRDGFHCSPLIGRIVADGILGSEEPYQHPFVPHRRPFVLMSAEESTEEAAYQSMCSWVEASYDMPLLYAEDVLKKSFLSSNERLYEALGADCGISPDLVAFLALAATRQEGPELELFRRVKALLEERGATPNALADRP